MLIIFNILACSNLAEQSEAVKIYIDFLVVKSFESEWKNI